MQSLLKNIRTLPNVVLFAIIVVIPAVAITCLHFHYPIGDSWNDNLLLYFHTRNHPLSWQHAFMPHNEHRLILTRLFYAINYKLSPHSMAFMNHISYVFFLGFYFLLVYHFKHSAQHLLRGTRQPTLWFYVLLALLVFPASSYEMWQWQFIVQFPLTLCFLTLSLFACTPNGRWPRILIITFYSVLGTLSSANGLLIWPCVIMLLILHRNDPSKIIFYIACTLIAFIAYSHNTHAQAMIFNKPWQSIAYFFTFLGNSIGSHTSTAIAPITGALLFFMYIGTIIMSFYHSTQQAQSRCLPWLALGLFGIGNAFLGAISRIQFTVDQALSGRYVCFSLLIVICVVAIVRLQWEKLLPQVKFLLSALLAVFFIGLTLQFYFVFQRFTTAYLYSPQEIAMPYNVYLPLDNSIFPPGNDYIQNISKQHLTFNMGEEMGKYKKSDLYSLPAPQPNYLRQTLSPDQSRHLGLLMPYHLKSGRRPQQQHLYGMRTGSTVKGFIISPKTKHPLSNSVLLLDNHNQVQGIAFIAMPLFQPHPGTALQVFGFTLQHSISSLLWLYKNHAVKQDITRRLY